MDKFFLCCDWGTSAFRLRLVNGSTTEILAEDTANTGIANVYEQWQQKKGLKSSISFYLEYIQRRTALLEQKSNFPMEKWPLIISGMVSSSIGMKELAYKKLPFAVDGSDLIIEKFQDETIGRRQIILISGVSSADDVMRGEETLLIGAIPEKADREEEIIFIFPGTHSKHIHVREGQAIAFKTYMTGEFFDLLANKSILSHSVVKNDHFYEPAMFKSFEKGVLEGLQSNLLNSSFHVRINSLFNNYKPEQNYYYLSGLLIGYELKELQDTNRKVSLVCDSRLMPFYKAALEIIVPVKGAITSISAEDALVQGQLKIYHSSNN